VISRLAIFPHMLPPHATFRSRVGAYLSRLGAASSYSVVGRSSFFAAHPHRHAGKSSPNFPPSREKGDHTLRRGAGQTRRRDGDVRSRLWFRSYRVFAPSYLVRFDLGLAILNEAFGSNFAKDLSRGQRTWPSIPLRTFQPLPQRPRGSTYFLNAFGQSSLIS
jgi:hypothetical protein